MRSSGGFGFGGGEIAVIAIVIAVIVAVVVAVLLKSKGVGTRESESVLCPKCGAQLPGSATFCAKCGNALPVKAAGQTASSQTVGASGSVAVSGVGSYMPIVRIALGIALILLMFAPLLVETYSYTGMVMGASSSSKAYTVFDIGNALGAALYVVPVVAVIAGAVHEKVGGLPVGRWISLAGFAFLVVFVVIFFFNYGTSNTSEYANAYVAQASHDYSIGWGCWAIAVLSILGIASCLIKKS